MALGVGALPRVVGAHPETKEDIIAGVGRYGPYLKYQNKFTSIKGDDDPLTIKLDRAVEVLAAAPKKNNNAKKPKTKKKK